MTRRRKQRGLTRVEMDNVILALAKCVTESDAAKMEFKRAMRKGEYQAATRAQRRLSKVLSCVTVLEKVLSAA
jgi:hypothetical protein